MTEPRTRLGDEADAIRKVSNEIQLRKLNERIEEHHLRVKPTVAAWVCECADETCAQPVKMTIAEYEAVRAEPTYFAVAEGHVVPDIERVVEKHDRYTVVEKVDPEAAQAAEERLIDADLFVTRRHGAKS